jgi:hypothetical protein
MRSGLVVLALVIASDVVSGATVSVPASMQSGTQHDVVVPIKVAPATGVTSMDFALAYDDDVLDATGVFRTTATGSFTLSYEIATPGVVELTLDGGPPLSGTREVAWIVFRLVGATGSSSTVSWTFASLNGGAIAAQTQDGAIHVTSAASSVGSPDGRTSAPGVQVEVPIFALPATGGNSFDLVVRFNPDVLDPVSASKTSITTNLMLVSNLDVPGEVRLALFGTQPVSGSGPIVNVSYQVLGPLGAVTPLDTTRGDINEGAISTVLDDGLLTVCTNSDVDGDGTSSCAGDCDETDPLVEPGAPELCNGLDDDCDGGIDDVAAPTGKPVLQLDRSGGSVELAWSAVAASTGYDIVRGSLVALRASGGDFASVPVTCLDDDRASTALVDSGAPAEAWYLVRAVNCGVEGSYDADSLHQAGSRDGELAGAAGTCP